MTLNKFNLPDVGEGLTEAEIVAWKVKAGDTVAVNDVLCEIETAKSLVELPSPFAGTVTELLVPEGVTVDVGTPIISVSDAVDAPAPAAAAPAPAPVQPRSRPPPRPCTARCRLMTPTPANQPGARPAARWWAPVPRPTPSSAGGGFPPLRQPATTPRPPRQPPALPPRWWSRRGWRPTTSGSTRTPPAARPTRPRPRRLR